MTQKPKGLLKRSAPVLKRFLLEHEGVISRQIEDGVGPFKDFKVLFFDIVGRWPNGDKGTRK